QISSTFSLNPDAQQNQTQNPAQPQTLGSSSSATSRPSPTFNPGRVSSSSATQPVQNGEPGPHPRPGIDRTSHTQPSTHTTTHDQHHPHTHTNTHTHTHNSQWNIVPCGMNSLSLNDLREIFRGLGVSKARLSLMALIARRLP